MSLLIETDNLILRPPQAGDELPLNLAIKESLPELARWMPWASDSSLEITKTFIDESIANWGTPRQKEMPFIVLLKQELRIIGASGYNDQSDPSVPYFEIGYWIHSHYVGRGLATELSIALTRYAFDYLHAVRVQICCQAENNASLRVIEKCGYHFEARLHNQCLDLVTRKPTDRLVFACFDTQNLPSRYIKFAA
ncbi:GNAT family N-acetyltransferase [Legionella hackeliae]|uniref:Putative acetyltransferase n=1 Tax=Legionella hackeliae TaxID=449 RepID=A0A0A8UTK4_LEGHA|nr:GNAT family N-acetyltransferase [Legionella hackeliae]KTD12747.1 multifunctional nucleotidyltransferase/glutamate rich protein GrpB/ribosomal protein alanine acetyltransferase [Legionella hackeliae]CEK12170.1 putative acetyltransferase [Legionella hackeliae]STX48956.1 nucleotidyltransferase PLUS glutamate rich protein GrpB PLUS ribosomal protein alanine acetyltransferase [Legionella hackeliae]